MKKDTKKKKLKILIPIFSVLFIIGIFLITYFIDTNRFYSNLKNKNSDYPLKVTFLVMDEEKIPKDVDLIKEIHNYIDSSLYSTNLMIPMKKEGDFLLLDLNGNVNKKLLDNINNYSFTLNDLDGNIIEDCEFDSKTKIAKIPASYYENREQDSPVQLEVFSLMKKSDYENLPIETNIKKIYSKTGTQKQDSNSLSTTISLKTTFLNEFSKKDIEIHVNGYDTKVSGELFEFNSDNKTITLMISPVLIDRLDIRINNNIISRVFAESISVTEGEMNAIKLKSKPSSNWVGSSNSYSVRLYNYDSSTSEFTTGFHYCGSRGFQCAATAWSGGKTNRYVSDDVFDYDYSYYYADGSYKAALNFASRNAYNNRNNDSNTAVGAAHLYPYEVDLNHLSKSGKIDFTGAKKEKVAGSTTSATDLFIPLACVDHTSAAATNNNYLDVTVTLVSAPANADYMILRIRTSSFHTQIGDSYIKVTWPKAYIRITKRYIPSSDNDGNERVFKLYEDDNEAAADRCKNITERDLVASTADPNTGYVARNANNKITYYYLGWPENGKEAILDKDKKYCLYEEPTGDSYFNDHTVTVSYSVAKVDGSEYTSVNQDATTSGVTYRYGKVAFGNDEYDYFYNPTNDISRRFRVDNSTSENGCIEINKTDGYDDLAGAEFELFTGSDCQSGNSTGQTATTDNDGVATFENLTAGAYSAKEIEGVTGHAKSSTICKNVTVGTSSTCKTLKFTNVPLKITVYKKDDNQKALSNVRFKIKNSNTSKYITVSGRNSHYNNCYVYTGESDTGTEMKTDSNGQICVVKAPALPSSKKYIAEETRSLSGYAYDKCSKEITTSTSIESQSSGNTCINHENKIAFYKKDESGRGIKNVQFKVKPTGEDEYITVESTKDSDGCYVYDGMTSEYEPDPSILKTDNNGRICISKIPGYDGRSSTQNITYIAEEIAAPDGYVFENGKIEGITPDKEISGVKCGTTSPSTTKCSLINKPLVINFYKVLEDGTTPKGGAEFVLSQTTGDTTKYMEVEATQSTATGFKGCYEYKGMVSSKTAATKLISNSTTTGVDVAVGEVCVIKVPSGTYKATETKALEYHTFGEVTTRDFTTSSSRKTMSQTDSFINRPTEFEFEKKVTEEDGLDDIWKSLTTEQLKTIPFKIYNIDDPEHPVEINVIETSVSGVYEYAGNTLETQTGTATTTLHLNNDRKIKVYHLPKGEYKIVEDDCCCETSCSSPSSNICYGFYSPKYTSENLNSYTFTILLCEPNLAIVLASTRKRFFLYSNSSDVFFEIITFFSPSARVINFDE